MSLGIQYDPIRPKNEWPIKYEYNGFSVDKGEATKTVNFNGKDYIIRVVFDTENKPVTPESINKELDCYTAQRCNEIVNVALDIGLEKETSAKTTDKRKPQGRVIKSVRFNFSNPLSPIAYKQYENKKTKAVNTASYLAKLNHLVDESKRNRFEKLYHWFANQGEVRLDTNRVKQEPPQGQSQSFASDKLQDKFPPALAKEDIEKKRQKLKSSTEKRSKTRDKLKNKKNSSSVTSSEAAAKPTQEDTHLTSLSHQEMMTKIERLEKMMTSALEEGENQLKRSVKPPDSIQKNDQVK